MQDLLPINWYIESPIDFEHKQYVLLSYLQIVDSNFINKKLSPHLLHLESLIRELTIFEKNFDELKKEFDKSRYYLIFNDNPKLDGEKNLYLEEVGEIVSFSKPLLENRFVLGNHILRKNKQLLY